MHVGQNEESRSSDIMEKRGSREVGESPKVFSHEANYSQRGRNREGVAVMNPVDQDGLQVVIQFIQKAQKGTFILHS